MSIGTKYRHSALCEQAISPKSLSRCVHSFHKSTVWVYWVTEFIQLVRVSHPPWNQVVYKLENMSGKKCALIAIFWTETMKSEINVIIYSCSFFTSRKISAQSGWKCRPTTCKTPLWHMSQFCCTGNELFSCRLDVRSLCAYNTDIQRAMAEG